METTANHSNSLQEEHFILDSGSEILAKKIVEIRERKKRENEELVKILAKKEQEECERRAKENHRAKIKRYREIFIDISNRLFGISESELDQLPQEAKIVLKEKIEKECIKIRLKTLIKIDIPSVLLLIGIFGGLFLALAVPDIGAPIVLGSLLFSIIFNIYLILHYERPEDITQQADHAAILLKANPEEISEALSVNRHVA